ncbi:hypothetical protein K449DRAFT_152781 [Hypoxylon sp. EC38]|nr:hypothetical protein K449DRAFT_152781 [Hypoxylon sp. EC38]
MPQSPNVVFTVQRMRCSDLGIIFYISNYLLSGISLNTPGLALLSVGCNVLIATLHDRMTDGKQNKIRPKQDMGHMKETPLGSVYSDLRISKLNTLQNEINITGRIDVGSTGGLGGPHRRDDVGCFFLGFPVMFPTESRGMNQRCSPIETVGNNSEQ